MVPSPMFPFSIPNWDTGGGLGTSSKSETTTTVDPRVTTTTKQQAEGTKKLTIKQQIEKYKQLNKTSTTTEARTPSRQNKHNYKTSSARSATLADTS